MGGRRGGGGCGSHAVWLGRWPGVVVEVEAYGDRLFAGPLAGPGDLIAGRGLGGLVVAPVPLAAERRPESLSTPRRAVSERRMRLVVGIAVVADLAGIGGAFLLAGVIQNWLSPAGEYIMRPNLILWSLIPAMVAILALYGLYDRPCMRPASEEARRLFHAVSVGVVCLVTASFLFKLRVELTRTWIGAVWLASMGVLGLVRVGLRRAVHRLNDHGVLGVRTLVVGVNEEARTIARTLGRQRWLGYHPTAFVSTDPTGPGEGARAVSARVDGLAVAGSLERVAAAVADTDAGAVIVATTAIPSEDLAQLYRSLQTLDVEVRISAGLPQVAASRVTVEPLDGLAVLSLRRNELSQSQAVVKRVFDATGAVLLCALAAPVMAAVALVVRLTSSGPVLFRQVRVGAGGRPFTICKFRTMVSDAEHRLHEVLAHNEADGPLFKMREDPRVTTVGKVLRRWGLDELPQLWNVIRGDMSLVGPRPPLPEETERYDQWVRGRLRVKPGITGLWQVNGRHELTYADYVRYDLFYVENWSLGLDLYVIARTLPALLSRRGAH